VGYSYGNNKCNLYGPGLDRDLEGGWIPLARERQVDHRLIAKTDGDEDYVCQAAAGRNNPPVQDV
jgi:hypothetical protein